MFGGVPPAMVAQSEPARQCQGRVGCEVAAESSINKL